MQNYGLWLNGEVIIAPLRAEPRNGDVINQGGVDYTVIGRRFENGNLYFVVITAPESPPEIQ